MTTAAVPELAPATLPWWWRPVVAYVRRELPLWGRLYALAGGNRQARWRDAGFAAVAGKLHGYRMPLDLSNWSERLSFCLARYHDLPVQLALQGLLRPGDTFVDVGANIGMLSLLACRLVGDGGLVLGVEPNPRLCARLEELARANGLRQLRVEPRALGSAPARAELHEFAAHSGWGSLLAAGPDGAAATGSFPVEVTTGDELLAGVAGRAPLTLKIDVEGYELPVLQGLGAVLDAHRPAVLLEVVPDHQRRAGATPDVLFEPLLRRGYRGWLLWQRRRGLRRQGLRAFPLDACPVPATDALFLPSHGVLSDRGAALLDTAS